MKLGGINITYLGAYKKHFALEEVWENIENGVLLEFQKDLAKQEDHIAEEIVKILEAYEQNDGLTDVISEFYSNGKWNVKELERKLEPLSSKSRDHENNYFYSRNWKGIQKIICDKTISWNGKKAALFYWFLLSLLQVKPREAISEEEFAFIKEKLSSVHGGMEYTDMREQEARLYPYSSGVLYLRHGEIINEKGKQISSHEEQISCYAYTEDLGFIAITEQGTLSSCMEPAIRYEIELKREETKTEDDKIVMVSAYGGIYVLLLENGTILTNVLDSVEDWKDIRWIGTGLNSMTAVRGNNRNLLELGSDSELNDFSDVKAAYTWSTDGYFRYVVLKENGDLIMDDKVVEKGVSAANVSREGYLFAIGQEVFLRNFDSGEKLKYKIQPEYTIIELCRYHSNIYCRARLFEEEKLFTLEESRFRKI